MPPKSKLGKLELFVAALAVVLLIGSSLAAWLYVTQRAHIAKGVKNCRSVHHALQLFACDNSGAYSEPEVTTSNEVFRNLFTQECLDDETIFSCPLSSYKADGVTGRAPDFKEAVKPGENHWAMMKGMYFSSYGSFPIVFETPKDATWPPRWDPSAVRTTKKGRTWIDNRIIMAFNDGSVVLHYVDSTTGKALPSPAVKAFGADLFEQCAAIRSNLSILDVETPPTSPQLHEDGF